MPRPHLHIVAGSNGSGKTTFASRFLPRYAGTVDFINVDLIAKGLSPFDVERAATAAGRIALERFAELASANRNFAIETTLSGRAYVKRLRHLQAQGYLLHLYFLWIPDPTLAIYRIRQRVRLGGHNVPPEVVRRRYHRTLENLMRFYWPLVDYGQLLDNSGPQPRPIAAKSVGNVAIFDATLYNHLHGSANQNKTQA